MRELVDHASEIETNNDLWVFDVFGFGRFWVELLCCTAGTADLLLSPPTSLLI